MLIISIAQQANPNGPDRKRALVRIEDVGPDADPAELRAIADLLYARRIPFSVAVYPVYKDPNGAYNGGVPVTVKMSRAPAVVAESARTAAPAARALRYHAVLFLVIGVFSLFCRDVTTAAPI